jgi:hypothetical protein
LDLLSEAPVLPFSITGGIILPILDLIVSSRTREYAIFIVAALEPTGILFNLLLSSHFLSSPLQLSFFKLFAVWQALQLLPPMGRYIRGKETDMGFFRSTAIVELQLMLYFGPTIITLLVKLLWPISDLISMVLISLVDAYATCPDGLGKQLAAILLPILIPRVRKLTRLHNRYDLNIRGLFMHVCETLIAPLNRLEISIGQRRREPREQPYKYRELELGNIRLLKLKRKSLFSQPSCELIEVSLDKAPPFEAISYSWGLQAPSIPIDVDGAVVLVTATIDELLWYRRSIFTSYLFWIDGICINQKNLKEKNSQLPMMAKIYGQAVRVIVWLGAPESRKDTRIVRKMIRALVWPETIISTVALLPSLFGNEEEAFIAVGKLFSHPWFERIWIVQEVAAGKIVHVMYHGVCIEWEVLAAAANRLGHNTELKARLLRHNLSKAATSNTSDYKPRRDTIVNIVDQIHWPHLEFLTNIRHSTQSNMALPLSFHLVATRACKASDPKDKIFGLLGIAGDGQELNFLPSYNDDVGQVFLKATAFVLSTKEWFLLLSTAGRGYDSWNGEKRPELMDELPSWVPGYNSDMVVGTRPATIYGLLFRDPAGKVTFFGSNDKIIQLQVFSFDKIKHLGPKAKIYGSSDHLPNPDVPIDAWTGDHRLATWYIGARQLARQKLSSSLQPQEIVDQNFWELCMSANEYIDAMGTVPTLYAPLSVEARKLFESCLSIKLEELKIPPTIERFQETALMIMYLARRFAFSTTGKAFCITATGHMALVPPLAKDGDTLVHVRGGYIPMVLREKGPGVRRAELVGTCLVQGVQDVHLGSHWENWLLE